MKRIYVSDEIHQMLKEESSREGRTIRWLAEDKLLGASSTRSPKENTPSPKNAEAENLERAGTGVASTVLPKDYDFCKHDQVKGFCKKGCK